MLRNNFKNLPFLFFILTFFIIGLPLIGIKAQAPPPTEIENPLGTEDFEELVSRIATWVFNIGIALATVVFLWSGFQFLISGGSDPKVAKAKKTMFWAVVGLIICLCGAGITTLIKEFLGAS